MVSSSKYLGRVTSKALGQLLIEHGLLTQEQCDQALVHAQQQGVRLGEALLALGYINDDALSHALGEQFGVRPIELDPSMVDSALVQRFPFELLRQHLILPLLEIDDEIVVVTSDPNDIDALKTVASYAGSRRIVTQLGNPIQIRRCLEQVVHVAQPAPAVSLPHTTPVQTDLVNWLLAAALHAPEADIIVQGNAQRAVVMRANAPDGAAPWGAHVEHLHEFAASLLPLVRDTLWARCVPVPHTQGQVAMWATPMYQEGRHYSLQLTQLRHAAGQLFRLRPLLHLEPQSHAPAPESTVGEAQLTLVCYERRQQLERFLAAVDAARGAQQLVLLLQEASRVLPPRSVVLPGLAVDAPALAAALHAGLVVFDYPVGAELVARVRYHAQCPPAVIVCAPLHRAQSSASPPELQLSPVVHELMHVESPQVVVLAGEHEQSAVMDAQAARELFGRQL